MHAGSYQPVPRGEAERSVPWDSAGLRQELAVSFFSIWQHQIQVLMQGVKQAWRCSPAAFEDTPRALGECQWPGLATRGLGGYGVVDEVGERHGTNSPGLYRELWILNGNLQSPSFRTLLGQFP